MNKETFLYLVPNVNKDAKNHNSDYITSSRFNLNSYEFNYSHILKDYLRECGCRIQRDNWNTWDDLYYIYYTSPTKYVDPSEFFDSYTPRFHIDTPFKKLVFWILLNAITICLGIVFVNAIYL